MIKPSLPAQGRTYGRRFLMTKAGAVANPLNQLALGIAAEQLRRIPDIVGIGGGLKAAAIASVLRGGWMSSLVTDAGVARRLLAYDHPQLQEKFEACAICQPIEDWMTVYSFFVGHSLSDALLAYERPLCARTRPQNLFSKRQNIGLSFPDQFSSTPRNRTPNESALS
jgi:hypothetical protein